MAKEIKSIKDIQERFKEISKKRFYRMALLCDYSLYKKDGSKTLFAERFDIDNYDDLYNWFKKVKKLLKNDNEDEAFFYIGELLKSVNGRIAAFVNSQFNVNNMFQSLYIANIFSIRTVGFILDNLLELKEVFKMLEEYRKAQKETGNISKEIEKSGEVKLEKEDKPEDKTEYEDIKEKTKEVLREIELENGIKIKIFK